MRPYADGLPTLPPLAPSGRDRYRGGRLPSSDAARVSQPTSHEMMPTTSAPEKRSDFRQHAPDDLGAQGQGLLALRRRGLFQFGQAAVDQLEEDGAVAAVARGAELALQRVAEDRQVVDLAQQIAQLVQRL